MTQEKLTQSECPTLTLSVRDFLVRVSPLRESGEDSLICEALLSLKLPESLEKNGLHFFFWKMSQGCCRMTAAGHLKPSSPHLRTWGILWNGVCITANFSESPKTESGCILSDILEEDVSEKYFLSAVAMARILSSLSRAPQGQRVYDVSGVACTQTAGAGGWGGKTGLYFIDLNSDPKITDAARCVTARQDSGVSKHRGEHSGVLVEESPRAILRPDREKTRQNGRRMKQPEEPMFTLTAQDRHGVYHRGRIRKLTPRECWRLQGFTDEQFNKAAACIHADGHLYKMAGNSVSVPGISPIGRKIRYVNEKYHITEEKHE